MGFLEHWTTQEEPSWWGLVSEQMLEDTRIRWAVEGGLAVWSLGYTQPLCGMQRAGERWMEIKPPQEV